MKLEGVYPPIATPFDAHDRLDTAALAENIQRWEPTGLSGYVVAGSNGESVLLEAEEIALAVRVAKEAAPARLVIAGTGRESTRATLRLTNQAAESGADAALVMAPSFFANQMTFAALQRFYEDMAEAAELPIILYNVPQYTHINMAPELVARLAAHPRIVGIKDSAGHIGQLAELVHACPTGFPILVGNAPAFLSGLQAGAAGGVLALANVAPGECVELYQLARAGHYAEAWALYHRLMPLARAVTTGYGVPGLKAALDLLGYRGGRPRPPLLPLGEPERQALAGTIAACFAS